MYHASQSSGQQATQVRAEHPSTDLSHIVVLVEQNYRDSQTPLLSSRGEGGSLILSEVHRAIWDRERPHLICLVALAKTLRQDASPIEDHFCNKVVASALHASHPCTLTVSAASCNWGGHQLGKKGNVTASRRHTRRARGFLLNSPMNSTMNLFPADSSHFVTA